jgi:hypothetical protein
MKHKYALAALGLCLVASPFVVNRIDNKQEVVVQAPTPIVQEVEVKVNPKVEPISVEQITPRAYCSHRFNADQSKLLDVAYEVGKVHGYPETIQAILIAESIAGLYDIVGNRVAPVGKRAYGVMQMKTVAARFVYYKYPEEFKKDFPGRKYKSVADEEIIAVLLTNHRRNIELGTLNFKLMVRYTDSWDEAVTAYYTGLNGLKSVVGEHFYLTKVRNHVKTDVRRYNKCSPNNK